MPRGAAQAVKPANGPLRFALDGLSRCRRWPVLRLELVQKLPEGHFSCPTGRHHRGKKDWRLLNRVRSSGAINLPPPRVRRRCSELHDN
jgi:hypothetical protein